MQHPVPRSADHEFVAMPEEPHIVWMSLFLTDGKKKRRFRTDGFSARYRLSLHRAKSNRRRIDGGTVEVMAIGGRQDSHARLQLLPGPVGRLAGGLALASVTSSPPTPHVARRYVGRFVPCGFPPVAWTPSCSE